jgi:hypothetical protein
MDFWFIVVHALSLRCFTLTVRPRTALPLPLPRALFFLLFRRLRFIGGSLSQVDALSARISLGLATGGRCFSWSIVGRFLIRTDLSLTDLPVSAAR